MEPLKKLYVHMTLKVKAEVALKKVKEKLKEQYIGLQLNIP